MSASVDCDASSNGCLPVIDEATSQLAPQHLRIASPTVHLEENRNGFCHPRHGLGNPAELAEAECFLELHEEEAAGVFAIEPDLAFFPVAVHTLPALLLFENGDDGFLSSVEIFWASQVKLLVEEVEKGESLLRWAVLHGFQVAEPVLQLHQVATSLEHL